MFGFKMLGELRNEFRAERVGTFNHEPIGIGIGQTECDRENC
jgi:hypothetical protein